MLRLLPVFAFLSILALSMRATGETTPAPAAPKQQSINELIGALIKADMFNEAGVTGVAKEVARRLWWPDGPALKARSVVQSEQGRWTVVLELDRVAPAVPGCEIVLSRHGLHSAKFLFGE